MKARAAVPVKNKKPVLRLNGKKIKPLMAAKCATCPFGENGDIDLRNSLLARLTKHTQICHHPALSGKPQTHLCRGFRDAQLPVFHALRIISAPTDEAWKQRLLEVGATES